MLPPLLLSVAVSLTDGFRGSFVGNLNAFIAAKAGICFTKQRVDNASEFAGLVFLCPVTGPAEKNEARLDDDQCQFSHNCVQLKIRSPHRVARLASASSLRILDETRKMTDTPPR